MEAEIDTKKIITKKNNTIGRIQIKIHIRLIARVIAPTINIIISKTFLKYFLSFLNFFMLSPQERAIDKIG